MRQILNVDAHLSVKRISKTSLAIGFTTAIDMIKVDLDAECSDVSGQFDLLNERLFRSIFIEYTDQEKASQPDPYAEQIAALHTKFDVFSETLNQLNKNFDMHGNLIAVLIGKTEEIEATPSKASYFRMLTENEKHSLLIDVRKRIDQHFRRSGLYLKAYEHLIQYRRVADLISTSLENVDDLSEWAKKNIRGYDLNAEIINQQIKLFGSDILSVINNKIGDAELEMRIGDYKYR